MDLSAVRDELCHCVRIYAQPLEVHLIGLLSGSLSGEVVHDRCSVQVHLKGRGG